MFKPYITIGQGRDGEWGIEIHDRLYCDHEGCVSGQLNGEASLQIAKMTKEISEGIYTAITPKHGGC